MKTAAAIAEQPNLVPAPTASGVVLKQEDAPREVTAETLTVKARDGHDLGITLFMPASEPERVVIVSAATAVRRSFYEPYARYLAKNGCAVITWDFRGIGGSRHQPIAKVEATILDWARKDYPAIIDFAAASFPGKPLQIVGHSVGGQLVGAIEDTSKIDAVCTVAAMNGYWLRYPAKEAITYGFLWYVLMPLLSHVMGYFPAKRMKLGEDLPRGVALEWARFCRSPDYMVNPDGTPVRDGFDAYEGPVLAFSIDDDVRAPEKCVKILHENFKKADVEHRHVRPKDVGGARIGHVGFFVAKFKHSLWKESLDWLRAHS